MVKFVVRGYRVPDGRIVVEFQRRAGCCMICAKVVESLRSVLAPAGSCLTPTAAIVSPVSFKAGLTEPLLQQKGLNACADGELVEKKLEELRCCLSNSKEDVLVEFCKVLIPLSQLCPEYLSSNLGCADLVSRLASNYTGDIRLAAISCIANLAASAIKKDGSGGGDEAEWFERVLEVVVLALSSDDNPHVRREAARALMYMSDRFSGDIVRLGGLVALRKYSDSTNDRTLHGYVQAAVQSLLVC